MAPRKTRVVVDLIRGCPVNEALARLRFTPRVAAQVVEKVLKSAVANAQQGGKDLGDADALRVSRAFVDNGPILKRFQPRAQGRAFSIHKRMSHITVAVTPIEAKPKRHKAHLHATQKTKPQGKKAAAPAAVGQKKRKVLSLRPTRAKAGEKGSR